MVGQQDNGVQKGSLRKVVNTFGTGVAWRKAAATRFRRSREQTGLNEACLPGAGLDGTLAALNNKRGIKDFERNPSSR